MEIEGKLIDISRIRVSIDAVDQVTDFVTADCSTPITGIAGRNSVGVGKAVDGGSKDKY
jgi:hypothetical protein